MHAIKCSLKNGGIGLTLLYFYMQEKNKNITHESYFKDTDYKFLRGSVLFVVILKLFRLYIFIYNRVFIWHILNYFLHSTLTLSSKNILACRIGVSNVSFIYDQQY